jgi:hypothetical protein
MSVQTTYSQYHLANYPGQLVGKGPKTSDTYLVETAAGIAPGKVVGQGTADDQCVLGGDGIGLGIVVRNLDVENNASDEIVYAQNTPVEVLIEGEIVVYVSEAGAKGAALNYVDATGVIGVGAAEAGETDLKAELMETLTAAGNARIRLFAQKS